MRVVAGDEMGLVKMVDFEKRKSRKWGRQSRERAVQRLAWAGPVGDAESLVACAYKCAARRAQGPIATHLPDLAARCGVQDWRCRALGHSHCAAALNLRRRLSRRHRARSRPRREVCAPHCVVSGACCPSGRRCASCDALRRSILVASAGGSVRVLDWDTKATALDFSTGGPLSRLRCPRGRISLAATGGKEHPLQLWDVTAQRALWKAKNVKNDFLNVRVPVWIRDLAFVPDAGDGSHVVVTGTSYHQVRAPTPYEASCAYLVSFSPYPWPLLPRQLRLYDTRAQRRPVQDWEVNELPITAVAPLPGGNEVAASDTIGTVRRCAVQASQCWFTAWLICGHGSRRCLASTCAQGGSQAGSRAAQAPCDRAWAQRGASNARWGA